MQQDSIRRLEPLVGSLLKEVRCEGDGRLALHVIHFGAQRAILVRADEGVRRRRERVAAEAAAGRHSDYHGGHHNEERYARVLGTILGSLIGLLGRKA